MHFAAFPRGGRAALFIAFPLRCLNTLLPSVSISITTQCNTLKRLFLVCLFSQISQSNFQVTSKLCLQVETVQCLWRKKGRSYQLQDCVDAAIEE